ncbi:MAG: bifunctional methylenetetrahydrofolate dehydrogenase/methenyltetrahydrofolate cyclohydrolase [Alphaproteobacteria bacterium]|nr:bifunctional methylenetetrahydrofolate dehydrogenase/methenyltetrahydrofolate cyclohydrolase [Alphaproteobacteria bacterium]
MSKIIDGRIVAAEKKEQLSALAKTLEEKTGIKPGLAVLRVGDDPASQLYVNMKGIHSRELGYHFEEHVFPAWTPSEVLEQRIKELNEANHVHGIILQLPLPLGLDKFYFLSLIDPAKDVDGLHPLNAGKFFQGIGGGFVPCTPLGCLELIKTVHNDLEGLNACVVGRSLLVGLPMAALLLQQNCTLSIAHSKTQNLPALCKAANILVVAIGSPRFIPGEWIQKGATVIDVGINRLPTGELAGDVDFASARLRAGAITPVPGGVGPMTVVSLLRNTLEAAFHYAGEPFPL